MPLTNLHIKNWFKDEFTINSSTSLILPVTASNAYINASGNLIQGGDVESYLNPDILARAVKLEISVQENELQEGEGGDWGYYSVGIYDISISGYDGVLGRTWATQLYPQYIHPANPLYRTEYQPDFMGNGGNNVSTLDNFPYEVPGGFVSSTTQIGYVYDDDGNVLNGTTNNWYKIFTQEQTVLYGDQSLQDYVTEYGGTNNATGEIAGLVPQGDAEILTWESTGGITIDGYYYQQIETAEGEWFNPDTNVTYVDQLQSAASQWNPVVEKILMFDTIGSEYVAGQGMRGMQNNKIDVFVIFKDVQAMGYLNFDTLNNVFTSPQYGITINSSLADGGAWYETGAGVVHIDFDGVAQWTRVSSHPPEDTNTDTETNVGDTDTTYAGEGTATEEAGGVTITIDENNGDDVGDDGIPGASVDVLPFDTDVP